MSNDTFAIGIGCLLPRSLPGQALLTAAEQAKVAREAATYEAGRAARLEKAAEEDARRAVEAAAERKREEEAAVRKQELLNQIGEQIGLAQATEMLLSAVRIMVQGGTPDRRSAFAKFRRELQPLAKSYGYKIVLVGDKTSGMLVVI